MNKSLPAIALSLVLAACGPSAPDRAPLAGARIGGPFALVDGSGHRVTDRSFAGRYRIMYFGYTFCPDACPTDMAVIGGAMRKIAASDPALAKRIVPVFVTVDPARDTPAVVGRFARTFWPGAVGLTGSPAAVDAVAKEFAVYHKRGAGGPGGYLVDHSRQAYLMAPDGKPLALLPTEEGADATAAEIRRWAS